MNQKNDGDKDKEIMSVFNYTKHAIEKYEQNLANQENQRGNANNSKGSGNLE